MREVRTCDFCDDGASGVYEPLPASVPDAPRMLLCDGCRDRLESVVEPLLAHFEAGAAAGDRSSVDATSSATGTGAAPVEEAGTPVSEPGRGGSAERGRGDGAGRNPARTADPDPATDATSSAAGEEPGGSGGGSSDDGDVSVSESTDAGGRRKSERRRTPHGYRKVMRFLENRELPMDRSEAEHLAAEAYDIEEDAVGEAIDHAVRYGRFREVSGELKR